MNANKCKYSIKMIPLILQLKRTSANNEEFEKKLKEFFIFSEDPMQDLAQIQEFVERASAGDNLVSSTGIFDEVEQKRMGDAKTVAYDGTARAMYGADSKGYDGMKHSFISRIVESVIYNPKENIWYDPTKEVENTGYNHLDVAIFEYKQFLINTIRKGLSLQPVNLDINSPSINQELTEAIKETIIAYQNNSILDISDQIDIHQAYVILSNFNDLLREHTPFIEIKKDAVYNNTDSHVIDMYTYAGPEANLRTGWSEDGKIVSAKEQYSKLAEILLDYFQQYNNGRFIPNTSIGVNGFIASLKKMRLAILYSNNANLSDAKKEYYKGDKMDMAKMVGDYLTEVNAGNFGREYSTNLVSVLNGIVENIYKNPNIPEDIRSMFTRMFLETVAQKYRTLGTFNGEFKASNLEDNWIRNQNYNIQEAINGKILGFIENPDAYSSLEKTYNIELSDDSSPTSGDILISFHDGKNQVDIKIHYDYNSKEKVFSFKLEDGANYDGIWASKLIYDLTGHLVGDEYRSYTRNLNGENNTPLNDFAGAIGITVLGSTRTGNVQPFVAHNIIDTRDGIILFHKGRLFNSLETPAKIASLVAGSETANTVKDVNGNNLPTNGLTSLVHETDEFIVRYGKNGIFGNNLVALNPGLVGAPIIQEGITVNGRGKKNKSLSVRELYEFGIVFNFLNELSNGILYMQPTVNADKQKVLTLPFNIARSLRLPDGGGIALNQDLSAIANGNGDFILRGTSARSRLDDALMLLRSERYSTIALDLVEKYNTILKPVKSFQTLEDVDNYLVEHPIKYNELRAKFRNSNTKIEFVEEHTATKVEGGYARINETLLNKIKTFNGDTSKGSRFQKRMDRSKRRFAYDLISDGFRLNPFTTKGGRLAYNYLNKSTTHGSDWYEDSSKNIIFAKVTNDGGKTFFNITKENVDLLLDPKYDAIINPILESYYYANAILCDEYNAASIGEDYSHANKNKVGDPNKVDFDETEWEEFSEASRWVSSVKRNVIPGASLHPLLQYKWDGVAETIKVAAMSDISAATFSIFGVRKDDNDSMDGSGIGNIWEILLEKNSLIEASTSGYDLKTIGWDLDENGIPMMLKWAVYGITNERRRKGYLSKANVEGLYKEMNNIQFNKSIRMNEYFNKHCPNGFYIKDPETQQRLFINKTVGIPRTVEVKPRVFQDKMVYLRVAQTESGDTVYLDKHNKIYSDYNAITTEDLDINTIYDLDIFFGGAWAEAQENGRWKSLDLNYSAVLDIICSEHLKDYFIAYAVNKSAMKVGVRNLNPVDAWYGGKLDYFTMSTKHIGIQMNAEHELEFAEVTEMTQMISALAENWYAGDIVKQIYKDIGAVVEESLASIKVKIDTDDRDGLRIQFGKALIESFDQKEDTIGLAQAFLNKARMALKDGERPNIPFSAATINGAFIADVASRLTKKGIRRKYSGIAAVLSPAYNMMSYFRYVDNSDPTNPKQVTKTAESLPKTIREDLVRKGLTNFNSTSIWELCNSAMVKDDSYNPELDNKVLNPFIIPITRSYDIKQGDTIVIQEVTELPDGTKAITYTTKLVESWDDYNKYSNNQDPNVVGRLKYAPRDLQGGDIIVAYKGAQYSIFNFHTVIALHALNAKVPNTTFAAAIVQDKRWSEELVKDDKGNILLKESLQNIIQRQLHNIEEGKLVYDGLFGNKPVKLDSHETIAAECIMGKSFAQQFGLIEGDDISDILNQGWKFFYNRISDNYGLPDIPISLADAILYTKDGPILVKFGDILNPEKYNLTRNFKTRTVDDNLVLNDEVLCNTDGVQTYSYIKDGTTYNVITINNKERFEELLDSELVETHRFVITKENLRSYFNTYGTPSEEELNLLNQYKAGTLSSEELIQKVRLATQWDLKARIEKLSKQRFYAFRASLNIVGARIPTQAMQSFMPMKVVAFTNSTTNDIYVPRTQLWLQGSDLDIDKVYCLQYSILSNGILATMSKLSEDFDPVEVLKLGKPNGVHYHEAREKNNAYPYIHYEVLVNAFANINNDGGKSLIELFGKVIKSGQGYVRFEAPIDLFIDVEIDGKTERHLNEDRAFEFNKMKKDFIDTLNKHSLSNIKMNKEAALRNMVVSGILQATLKPSVQGIAGMPINMDEATDAAENSVLNDLEKHFSPDIPSSKWKLQVQALGAKDVVGISAVSVKCFFAETTYINMMMEQFQDLLITGKTTPENINMAMDLLSKLLIKNPITGEAMLISNVNLRKIIDKLQKERIQYLPVNLNSSLTEKQWLTDKGFDIIQCLKDLSLRASAIDTALSESGILSSATDNMKELILPKLNATAEFVDIYTSLLAIGVPFTVIANIMTSPMFTEMSRLTQSNLLDGTTTSYRLKTALEFFLNKRALPRVKKEMLRNLFQKVGWVYETDKNGKLVTEKEFSVTKNITMVQKALDFAYKQRAHSVEHSASDEYYGGNEDLFLEEYFNEEYIGNNKVTIEDASLEDLNTIINYLEECLNREKLFVKLETLSSTERYARFGTVKKQLDNLELILNEVLPRTEEQRILGRMLGINQGLRTDPYQMYSLVRSIENFINSQFKKYYINEVFVLNKFLNDNEYRERMCNYYDKCKWNVNVLKVITTVPHFKAMFDVMYMNEYVQSALSSKHEIANNVARALENEASYTGEPYERILNEKEYTQVERFINDWYITGWLAQQNFNVMFPSLSSVYSGLTIKETDTLSSPKPILINTLYNFASFKHLMETKIIPDLQKDSRFNGSGNKGNQNSFIMSLEFNVSKDRTTKKLNRYYRLPINMMTIDDSTVTTQLYERYLTDFNAVSDVYLQKYGQTIGDLFFIYNLIVNKDSFGRSSFTRLFENQVATKRGSALINGFYDYIASIDNLNNRSSIIKEIIQPNKLDDLKARIHQNVATSNIEPTNETEQLLQKSSSDFTFDMPDAAKNWRTFIETVYPNQSNTTYGKIKLEKTVVKNEILNNLKRVLPNDNVVILTDSQWNEMFADEKDASLSSPALIHEGKVYIRRTETNSATSIAHEFAHVILAALRFDEKYKDFYYNVLGKIDINKASEEFGAEIAEYKKYRIGIDLKEEIFAKYLEKWLTGKISEMSSIGAFLVDNGDKVKEALNLVFGTNIKNIQDLITFSNMTLEDALNAFGSSLFITDLYYNVSPDFLITAQRLSALKKFLFDAGKLIEDCK